MHGKRYPTFIFGVRFLENETDTESRIYFHQINSKSLEINIRATRANKSDVLGKGNVLAEESRFY